MKYRLRWDDVFTYQQSPPVESDENWIDRARNEVIDSAKSANWSNMLRILSNSNFLKEMTESAPKHQRRCHRLINCTRVGGKAWYTPLHHAAWNGAPNSVVHELLELGAWRSLKNSRGERPVDVARRRDHTHLVEVLTPEFPRPASEWLIERIEFYFHAVMLGRAARQIKEHRLRLPQLSPLLEYRDCTCWCTVRGMTGGFSYWFEFSKDNEPKLVSESWCRVVQGSGERHEITIDGLKMTESGFV